MGLRRTKDLKEFTIAATDADIGSVHDLYFDDEKWTIRYVVVETEEIFSSRRVLISPVALRQPALRALHIWVNLTWRQVDGSPSVDLHKSVSRQHEIKYHNRHAATARLTSSVLSSGVTSHGWSAPLFVAIEGGSVEHQIGGSSTDLEMLFTNDQVLDWTVNAQGNRGAKA